MAARCTELNNASKNLKQQGSKKGCCGLFAQKAPPFRQTIVLLRHSERQDRVDPGYKDSEEGKKWPFDAPITPAGITLAAEVAQELSVLHQTAHFSAIACSPYRRCLQTAAEVAKLLRLPVLIDQEIGEVYDREMPEEPRPWRSPKELVDLVAGLGIKHSNPILEDGGIKLFGKVPKYPETLENAKTRYIVRIETYIEQSEETSQNFIVCTHADAVAAALQMFERGNADVQEMEFCARITARRKASLDKKNGQGEGVYSKHWEVEFKGLEAQIMKAEAKMEKYYEKMHLENCEEASKVATKRKENRTKTDMMFASQLKDLPVDDDDEDSDEETGPPGKSNSKTPKSIGKNVPAPIKE